MGLNLPIHALDANPYAPPMQPHSDRSRPRAVLRSQEEDVLTGRAFGNVLCVLHMGPSCKRQQLQDLAIGPVFAIAQTTQVRAGRVLVCEFRSV